MKKKNLKDFMNFLLKEDNNIPEPHSAYEARPVEEAKDVSLDQVVDRYLIRYEKEAIPTVSSYEGDMFESKIPSFEKVLLEALNEADDDTEDAGDEDMGALGSDLDSTTEVGGGGGTNAAKTNQERAIINTPQINLQEFAKQAARLINNFETLLNPKNIILNRVENYIQTNYDQRTAQELMQILDTNYSLRTQDKSVENEKDTPTPYAAGALSTEG